MATETQQTEETQMTSGRVKWFNNKAGYGFISVHDCETGEERDIFVHHSEIKVEQSQYKYLVQGEYVEFVIGPINRDNKVDVHATGVSGMNGGKLMCETRNEVRSYRFSQPSTTPHTTQPTTQPTTQRQNHPQRTSKPPQQRQPPREREYQQPSREYQHPPREKLRRPQLAPEAQTEWMVVPRRRVNTVSQSRPSRQETTNQGRQPTIDMSC